MSTVSGSVAELLAGATEREVIVGGAGKSGAVLERCLVRGKRYVLKHLRITDDWTMRAAGDLEGAPLTMWRRGLLERLPDCINQPIVGVAVEPGGCALLMHHLGEHLVPVSDEPPPEEQHP